MATDKDTLSQISELVAEEKVLRARLQRGEVGKAEEHARLQTLETQLDQCWDLLRQRRALRDTGADPQQAAVRPGEQVEGYLS